MKIIFKGSHKQIRCGLYLHDELVAAISFAKPRFSKKYDHELVRFCNKLNTNVVGGASKLFSHFLKTCGAGETIVSYADRRWSVGTLYKNLGFTQTHISSPNYWYFSGLDLFHRVNFQKHKLSEKLDMFNPELTEWENMEANGWNRIWDCGNLVFKFIN